MSCLNQAARLLLIPALLVAGGCATQNTTPTPEAPTPTASTETAKPAEPVKPPAVRKAENELARGLKAYENGDYKTAGQALQQALELGLPNRLDQSRAYKHLAFIACAANQVDQCKGHFRKALAAYPKLTLSKAEAGHPIWGPAFQQVKAEKQK